MSMSMIDYRVPEGKALVLRVCHADMSSSRHFTWPEAENGIESNVPYLLDASGKLARKS